MERHSDENIGQTSVETATGGSKTDRH